MELRLLQVPCLKMEMKLEQVLMFKCDLCKDEECRVSNGQANIDKLRFCLDCVERVIMGGLSRWELWQMRSINTRRGGVREKKRCTFKEYKNWLKDRPHMKETMATGFLMLDLYRMGYRNC